MRTGTTTQATAVCGVRRHATTAVHAADKKPSDAELHQVNTADESQRRMSRIFTVPAQRRRRGGQGRDPVVEARTNRPTRRPVDP